MSKKRGVARQDRSGSAARFVCGIRDEAKRNERNRIENVGGIKSNLSAKAGMRPDEFRNTCVLAQAIPPAHSRSLHAPSGLRNNRYRKTDGQRLRQRSGDANE